MAADVRIVDLLIRAGAEINVYNMNAETPLMAAARAGRAAVVERLLRLGARVGMENLSGETALSMATAAAARLSQSAPPFPGDTRPPPEFERVVALLRAAGAK